MRRWKQQLNSRGDTIVEVLIAIAVISSVLAGAFAVSQKSIIGVRDSQERSEVLQTLQGQVEMVRAMALTATDKTSGVYATSPQYFCVKNSPLTRVPTSDPACTVGIYSIKEEYSPSDDAFIFYGDWDRMGGGHDSMQLRYRIQPGAAL